MRAVIRAATTRYGIAGLLVLGVLIVVGAARLMDGEAGRAGDAESGADPYASVSVGPDDGVIDPDNPDAVHGAADPSGAQTLPSGVPDPRAVAGKFATAWADTNGVTAKQWRDRLSGHATASLKKRLANVDPTSQPDVKLTGEPELVAVVGRGYAEVDHQTQAGALRIQLRWRDGRWAVDSIGWRDR